MTLEEVRQGYVDAVLASLDAMIELTPEERALTGVTIKYALMDDVELRLFRDADTRLATGQGKPPVVQ